MVFRTAILCSVATLASFSALWAQNPSTPPQDWFLRDPETDHLQGVSAERAYSELLKGRPFRTVIVAVIDSGVDADHEDLKGVMWTNEKEIPGNGVDDDKNGYVDDIHGWNFIGGKEGTAEDDRYGYAESYVTTSRPLMARPAAPASASTRTSTTATSCRRTTIR